jgi:hypothetical protein
MHKSSMDRHLCTLQRRVGILMCVVLLLGEGANMETKDKDGRCPLVVARDEYESNKGAHTRAEVMRILAAWKSNADYRCARF